MKVSYSFHRSLLRRRSAISGACAVSLCSESCECGRRVFQRVRMQKECIEFSAKQIVRMGLVQPATATLYDFYNPSVRCTLTYSAPKQNVMITKLCDGEVCMCAEGACPHINHVLSNEVNGSGRIDFACYSPIVDYAYTVRVLNISPAGSFDNYQASITNRLKMSNKDDDVKIGEVRHFLSQKSCQFQLKEGDEYLVMGQDGTTSDASRKMQYLLDAKSWVEAIPPEDICELRKYRSSCRNLRNSMTALVDHGCQI